MHQASHEALDMPYLIPFPQQAYYLGGIIIPILQMR